MTIRKKKAGDVGTHYSDPAIVRWLQKTIKAGAVKEPSECRHPFPLRGKRVIVRFTRMVAGSPREFRFCTYCGAAVPYKLPAVLQPKFRGEKKARKPGRPKRR